MKHSNHQVALYCRLSRDDGNGDTPSMSIENQKALLLEYATEREWKIYDVYVDDGLTGTNFDRPDFKRMKADIEAGKIDCVITKDLSRLGRNFVQTGFYTDEYFPENGVRYIAINDNIDTANDNNDMAGFYHVMNEFYPKQVSRKVKQVKKADMKQGKFIGGQAPYGYKKDPQDKYKLVIDEEVVPVVRRIFKDFSIGTSARQIADCLTREQIDSPRFYQCKQADKLPPADTQNVWLSATIHQMIRNQVYLGNMVQGKRAVVSFKTKKRRVVPEEDWVVIENMHEPIIEKSLWNAVQNRLQVSGARNRKLQGERLPSLFSGMLKCSNCGANLAFSRKELKNGSASGSYRCQSYVSKGKTACTAHRVTEDFLSQVVLNDIKHYTELTSDERVKVAQELLDIKGDENRKQGTKLKRRLREIEQRLNVVQSAFKKFYEDRIAGLLPDDMFGEMMTSYTAEKSDLECERVQISTELDHMSDIEDDITAWLELIKTHEDIDAIDRGTVCELIESVEIEETFGGCGERNLEIWVNYRFLGKAPTNGERVAV